MFHPRGGSPMLREVTMGILHDHIMARVEGSTPQKDLTQLGFEPDELYDEIRGNPLMTTAMLLAFGEGPPTETLAKYAMTWLSIGATLEKEKSGTGPDDIPTLPDEPHG